MRMNEPYATKIVHSILRSVSVLLLWFLVSSSAWAMPSFSTQMGVACSNCHTTSFGPALTEFGRQFKLNGYVWGKPNLDWPPLSAMVVSSYNNTRTGQPGGAAPEFGDNNNIAMDQASLFYAGRIYGKVGAFVQTTYSGIKHHFAWDNLDIRFADAKAFGDVSLVYGVSLNNNPTVQDLWNSTPAWSFPYMSSGLAPSPAAVPLIEGRLAQTVYGLTTYTMINNLIYLEAGGYKTLPYKWLGNLGVPSGDRLALKTDGFAPYWRATLQKNFQGHYVSLGTFGLDARIVPGGDRSAGTDRYTDVGVDATYQFANGGPHSVNANATLVYESQHLSASQAMGSSQNASNNLRTLRLNVGYVYQQTYAVTLSPFKISGSADTGLYAPGDISGSASGSPDSRGLLTKIEYIPFGKSNSLAQPWLNLVLGLEYVSYSQFNGGKDNYDGSGRSASDNNTLYGFLWLAI